MNKCAIKKDIYWVGSVDWNMRNFHGHTYTTQRGTTYNSYLIIDDKIALVDTVLDNFSEELIENIRAITPPEKIDYIIANHVERDHSGSLPALMKLCPKAKIFGTPKCREGLFKHYYENWNFQEVKTGDSLSLGRKTLKFVEMAMIHWPDSMLTFCPEEKVILSNDAFGQHYATSARFDDEVDEAILMDEAAKYYGNILWPLSILIQKKIDEIKSANLDFDMIAPSHGIIWRRNPAKIIEAYSYWANNSTVEKCVVVYETMWGATKEMARRITQGLIDSGITVSLFDINQADRTQIIKEMLTAKGFIFGSSTHDNDMLTNIAGFLEFVKGLKPKNRLCACFGSYGWAGGAVAKMEELTSSVGIKVAQEGLAVKFVPDENELNDSYEFGLNFAEKIKQQS